MKGERLIDTARFFINFGVLPGNPKAQEIAEHRIDEIARTADDFNLPTDLDNRGRIERMDQAVKLTELAQKFGFYK